MVSTDSATQAQQAQNRLETLSAFLDGEAVIAASDATWLGREADSQHDVHLQAWQSYHCIGEVMRSEPALGHSSHAEFLARWRKNAALEIAPHAHSAGGAGLGRPAASNQAMWRWVAGFAVVAVAAVVAWQLNFNADRGAVQLAAQTPEPATAVMIRNPEIDALLAQHRQHGGMSALQTPVGFLRTATYGQNDGR